MNFPVPNSSIFMIQIIKIAKLVNLEIKPFLHNFVNNYTRPLPFEDELNTIGTMPLIRDYLETHLFYIRHRTLTISVLYPFFQVTFPYQEVPQLRVYKKKQTTLLTYKFLYKKFFMQSQIK